MEWMDEEEMLWMKQLEHKAMTFLFFLFWGGICFCDSS
jgi:hypothetical protein